MNGRQGMFHSLENWYGGLMSPSRRSRIEGIHCSMEVERLERGVALVVIEGTDVGELGDAPFRLLEPWLSECEQFELFVDASRARGPSVDVSHDWALWMNRHRERLLHVSFLTGSPPRGVERGVREVVRGSR